MQETWVQSLDWEDSWRRERLPLQYSSLGNSMDCMSTGSQRVGCDWATFTFTQSLFLILSSSLFVTAVFFTFIVFHLFRVWDSNYMFWQMNLGQSINSHSSILAWRIPWAWEPVGYSPWGCREPNTTEWQALAHTQTPLTFRLNDISDKNSFWFISTTNLWLAFVFPWGNWRDWESSDYFLTILMQESFQTTF